MLVPAMLLWTGLIAFALPALFTAIGPSPELYSAALSYGYGRLPAAPFVVINFALSAFFRGISDTRTPMRAALVAITMNVFTAWVLIFGQFGAPKLGAAGAGLAMSCGSITMSVLLLRAFLRKRMRDRYATSPCRPDRGEQRRYLRTSAAIGGQWLLDMTTFAIFTSIVARMGSASMAASQAMLQLLSISFMQAMAIGQAAGTLVGRYIGAGDPEAAQRSYRSAQLLSLGVSAVVVVLFLAVPEPLLAIFSSDPAVLALARPLLSLGAFFQIIDAVGIVAAGALRGAGDTRWPFVVQASLAWALRLPVIYVCAVILGGGVFGAWAGELVYVCALAVAFGLRFHRGSWRAIAL
jgi:MATE family multidrug resistance protein